MSNSEEILPLPGARAVWLVSYPRSGNTLLRIIMKHCFNLPSGSVYPNDLDGNKALEDYVGHIEHGPARETWIQNSMTLLFKTHELPFNDWPAIYVVRDGRDVCVSLWDFSKRNVPITEIIAGGHLFGTWSNHLAAWRPWERPNTLLLRYEDMVGKLPQVLQDISLFLKIDIVSTQLPKRRALALETGGKWIRQKGNWRPLLKGNDYDFFKRINGQMMRKLGYSDNDNVKHKAQF